MTARAESIGADVPLVRLLQLASPSLPVGGFSYSQGLEYAVAMHWVHDAPSFSDWLEGIAGETLVYLEIPVLARLHRAAVDRNSGDFTWWVDFLVASRETRELREEESSRGRAMHQVLKALSIVVDAPFVEAMSRCQSAGLAWAAAHWRIDIQRLAVAFAFSWLENSVTAGIKLIPLGQSDGQRLLAATGASLPDRVEQAIDVSDDRIGGSLPAQSIASSRHETQYTRLFRS